MFDLLIRENDCTDMLAYEMTLHKYMAWRQNPTTLIPAHLLEHTSNVKIQECCVTT